MTPEQEAARRKNLASAARALLSLQVGLVHGCNRVWRCACHLGDDFRAEFKQKYPVFVMLADATNHLPVASDRLMWEPSALLAKDIELSQIELLYRSQVMSSCFRLLQELSNNSFKGMPLRGTP